MATVWMINRESSFGLVILPLRRASTSRSLSNPAEVVSGTVKELADKYQTEVLIMTGFPGWHQRELKGYENPIETMDENTQVKIEIDPEKLYYNMVEAKAGVAVYSSAVGGVDLSADMLDIAMEKTGTVRQ